MMARTTYLLLLCCAACEAKPEPPKEESPAPLTFAVEGYHGPSADELYEKSRLLYSAGEMQRLQVSQTFGGSLELDYSSGSVRLSPSERGQLVADLNEAMKPVIARYAQLLYQRAEGLPAEATE
jgi:hypothetical protein